MPRVTITGTFNNPQAQGRGPLAADPKRRPILITGGAPRIAVDAIRYLTVQATGATAVALRARLATQGHRTDLLLGHHAVPGTEDALRYDSREDLERELKAWIAAHPDGVVVMAAAVNDYTVDRVESLHGTALATHAPGSKIPSGADELVIRLKPATKIIDRLRSWGLQGPLVAFKFEAADTVIASARSLRGRIGAALVVANSLDGSLQALVDALRVTELPDRDALLDALAARLGELAAR
jgi:phosphopantothenoylcysteine synthetase/decarboxylase